MYFDKGSWVYEDSLTVNVIINIVDIYTFNWPLHNLLMITCDFKWSAQI